MEKTQQQESEALFQWNAWPSIGSIVPLGLQHVVAAIVGVVTPALIVASACGMTEAQETTLIQAALVLSGIITILQAFPIVGRLGSALPIVMGTSFAYVPALQSVGVQFGYGAILGAEIIGGVVALVFAVFLKPIRKLFPTIVTGTVIFTIGVSLYPTAIRYMAGGQGTEIFGTPAAWIVAIVTFAVVFALNNFGKGIFKLGSLLFGIIVGVLVSIPFGMLDLSSVDSAGIVAFPQIMPFQIEFVPAACATIAIVFIVNCVQVIGELTSTTVGAMDRDPNNKELSGGIFSVGVMAIVGAFIGGMPSSTFGQNVGIVLTNKVINRYVIAFAGVLFVVAGMVPKLSAVLVAIPQPVIGGATVSVFATIAMNGVRLITQGGLTPRNSTIAGTSVALGLGIEQVAGCLAGTGMPDWVGTVFGSSALVVATLMAIMLNLILPKEEPTIQLSVDEKKAEDMAIGIEEAVGAGEPPKNVPAIGVDAHGVVVSPDEPIASEAVGKE